MRIIEWLRSLLVHSSEPALLAVTGRLPDARLVSGTENRVFCFRKARKTLLTEAGRLPDKLEPGEQCVVVPADTLPVSVERNDRAYTLRLEPEPDDPFAAFLERNQQVTRELLGVLCGNALDAILPGLSEPPPLERLRAKISVELHADGFRCVDVDVAAVERTPAELALPEAPAEAQEQARELEKLGCELGLDVPAPESGSPGERLQEMAFAMERQVRLQWRDAADAKGLERRLNLSGEERGSGGPAPVPPPSPTKIADIARPFTALVLRRTDIDDKLRRYVAETLDASLEAAEEYRKKHLARDLRQGGGMAEFAERLRLLRGRLDALPALRHGFGYTKPGSAEIRRRTQTIKSAADAAAGVHNAVRFLCAQTPGPKEMESAIAEAETAARHLEQTLKNAAQPTGKSSIL